MLKLMYNLNKKKNKFFYQLFLKILDNLFNNKDYQKFLMYLNPAKIKSK